mmetsp:Transcript_26363/g.68206  ORF Transcript_26363/g.68206 Transcript_26363/m.68206 type:complete len:470 (+) Transcript_26363:296-1705(+)
MASTMSVGVPAGPAGLRRSASSSATHLCGVSTSGSHIGLGLLARPRAAGMRRSASAAAMALPAPPCACTSAASCSGTGATTSFGRSSSGLSSSCAPVCGLPRVCSAAALMGRPASLRARRRTSPFVTAAAGQGAENFESWDEEDFRRALQAGAHSPGGAVLPPAATPPPNAAAAPSPDPAAALLPVFEWDLPDLPSISASGGAPGVPAFGLAKGRAAPWDRQARRQEGGATSSQPGSEAPPYRGPPFHGHGQGHGQAHPGPRPSSQQQNQKQPWGFEKKRGSIGRNLSAWSDNVVPPGIDVMSNLSALTGMEEVFVILFGVGDGGDEGIYSLKSLSGGGVAVDTVIAFESEVDAERYAALLEAVMVWKPNVCSILPVELLEFVVDSGLRCRLQPTGSHIFPPDWSVPMGLTDWERTARLRKGHYSVLEAEPMAEAAGAPHFVNMEPELALPGAGLEQMRQRLEDIYSAS